MCGICGFVNFDTQSADLKILQKMNEVLWHRGPDDEGFQIVNNVALASRRLSIIDLSTGHQPISNEEKTIWFVFNGEIYNFKELRRLLIKKGHRFLTKTDTETIVHLYEEYGPRGCLKYLNGMFAFALYDKKEKILFLARDRLGKKPLYYAVFENTFIFGSELKAIIVHSKVKKELDFNSLNKYLTYEYVPTPGTIFKNIYKLEPGYYLLIKNGVVKKYQYWDVQFKRDLENISGKEAAKKLDYLLEESVKKRLEADVPLGVFLSGGVDSSTIAYYTTLFKPKLHSFSIGFKESSFDESFYAKMASDYLQTNHHHKILSAKKAFSLIPEIFALLDEPLADPSIIPTFFLSKITREKVKVALSGDGGDEIFMGYDTFEANFWARFYELIPLKIRKGLMQMLVNNLPTSFVNFSFDFKAKKFITGFSYPLEVRHEIWLGSFPPEVRDDLLTAGAWKEMKKSSLFEETLGYFKKVKSESFWQQMIYLYLKGYLEGDILVKTDRASMFNSLEVRSPFLDYKLVDFVNSLPIKYKFNFLRRKYILKELMKGKLPEKIINRPKKGFGIPLAEWLTSEIKPLMLDVLVEKKIKKQGIFNYHYIQKLIDEHLAKKKDNRKLLWTLITFQLWQKRWLK